MSHPMKAVKFTTFNTSTTMGKMYTKLWSSCSILFQLIISSLYLRKMKSFGYAFCFLSEKSNWSVKTLNDLLKYSTCSVFSKCWPFWRVCQFTMWSKVIVTSCAESTGKQVVKASLKRLNSSSCDNINSNFLRVKI